MVTLVAETSPELDRRGRDEARPRDRNRRSPRGGAPLFGLSEVTVGAVASAWALPSDRKGEDAKRNRQRPDRT